MVGRLFKIGINRQFVCFQFGSFVLEREKALIMISSKAFSCSKMAARSRSLFQNKKFSRSFSPSRRDKSIKEAVTLYNVMTSILSEPIDLKYIRFKMSKYDEYE